MTEDGTIRRILEGLDWSGPSGPPLDEGSRILEATLGEGVVRWMTGIVDEGSDLVSREASADVLAPWPTIRGLALEIVTGVLLKLLGLPVPTTESPEQINRRLAEDIVARGVPISAIAGALRVMEDLWLTELTRSALAVEGGATVVPQLARTVVRSVDERLDALVNAISEEYRSVFERGEARIRNLIEALVAGQLPDEQQASETLGVAVDGWHLGCVLHAPPGSTLARGEVDLVAAAFGDATGSPLIRYETSGGQVWLWSSGPLRPRVPDVGELHIPAPVVAGIGEPRQGLTGVRRTHMEAAEALRITLVRETAERGRSFRDVALVALLSQDTERARWFVESELRDLALDTPDMRELRNTLRVYFSEQMRISPAAERLYIHRNTLRDRLRRIEDTLGYVLADRSAECQAALQLCELGAARG